MPEPTREDAWDLVCEWISSDSLRKHVLGVEAAMRAYARDGGEDEELWGITGLVHDLDYERYPDLETGHPRHALSELEARGYPAEVIDAVAGHAEFLGVPRTTTLAKTLFAARPGTRRDRKSTRLNSSHMSISYAVFCLKKK